MDKTELKQAAAMRLGTLDYANGIIETVHDPMLVLDDHLRVQSANHAFYQTFRVSPEATAGRLLFELHDGHWNIPRLRTLLEDVLPQHNRIEALEVEHHFPAIGRKAMLLNAHKIQQENAAAIVLAIKDVTERDRLPGVMITPQQPHQMHAVLDAVPVAVAIIAAASGRFSFVNRRAVELYGCDLLGTDLDTHLARVQALRPDGTPFPSEALPVTRALRRRETVLGEDMLIHHVDGKRVPVAVSCVPLCDGHGHIDAAIAIFDDISGRRHMEHSLVALNQSLEQQAAERTTEAQRQADQLRALASQLSQAEQHERKRLAKVLHDHVQQLIVGARMQVGRLKQDKPCEARAPIAEHIEAMLSEALEASRSLAVELSPPVLDDAGLVEALHWLASRMQEQHALKVRVQADAAAEPLRADVRFLLFECIRELLLNVVKHAQVGEAEVGLMRSADAEITAVVRDKGKGFDTGVLKQRRLDTMSFGLFSMQTRLAHLGGRIDIDSAPERGTRVTLVVAVAVEPSADSPRQLGDAQRHHGRPDC
ncbi:PAS domain-containing protein [uncultured Thiohalocapsa sp.]|uniref:PAS domain-containing protein n=1 Tax=uncultured Thiohalocapsa sp. TaxID=768990 RepID=UPI0025CBB5E6|nr:PAS domain-containing protein [uncultured Thiohalocapsa sp.]